MDPKRSAQRERKERLLNFSFRLKPCTYLRDEESWWTVGVVSALMDGTWYAKIDICFVGTCVS